MAIHKSDLHVHRSNLPKPTCQKKPFYLTAYRYIGCVTIILSLINYNMVRHTYTVYVHMYSDSTIYHYGMAMIERVPYTCTVHVQKQSHFMASMKCHMQVLFCPILYTCVHISDYIFNAALHPHTLMTCICFSVLYAYMYIQMYMYACIYRWNTEILPDKLPLCSSFFVEHRGVHCWCLCCDLLTTRDTGQVCPSLGNKSIRTNPYVYKKVKYM